MNLSRSIIAAGLACLLCGCGTINSRVSRSYFEGEAPLGGSVYGGVRFDAKASQVAFTDVPNTPAYERLVSLGFILDLPFSALLDTLLLPVTIPEEMQEPVKSKPEKSDSKSESNRTAGTSGLQSDHIVVTVPRKYLDDEEAPAHEPPIILPHFYNEEPIFRQW